MCPECLDGFFVRFRQDCMNSAEAVGIVGCSLMHVDGGQPMRTRTVSSSSPGNPLKQIQHRFELWRRRRKRYSPIPEPLWISAVELAREHGLHRTARALRLNYYSLKERLSAVEGPPGKSPKQATFVELLPAGASGLCACTIEMENAQGGKMKIHLQGLGSPNLAVLSDSFWRAS
jgi:hypothetical protein